MGRIGSIQAMRCVAAGLVLFAHAVDVVEKERGALGPSAVAGFRHLGDFGAIGVDLFFIISGFVMAEGLRDRRGPGAAVEFLRQRVLRIAPLWWLAATTALALGLRKTPCDAACLMNTLTFVPLGGGRYTMPTIDVGWTLGFEFGFYGLVALVIASGAAKPRRTLMMLLFLLPLLGPTVAGLPVLGWMTNAIVWEFALGVALSFLWRAGVIDRHAAVWRWGATVAASALAAEIWVGYGAISESIQVTAGAVSAARVVLWGLPMALLAAAALPLGTDGRAGTALRRLGDASYSIYLVHQPLFFVARGLLARHGAAGSADATIAVLCGAGVAAGLALHHAVERPLLRNLKRSATGTAPHLAAFPA